MASFRFVRTKPRIPPVANACCHVNDCLAKKPLPSPQSVKLCCGGVDWSYGVICWQHCSRHDCIHVHVWSTQEGKYGLVSVWSQKLWPCTWLLQSDVTFVSVQPSLGGLLTYGMALCELEVPSAAFVDIAIVCPAFLEATLWPNNLRIHLAGIVFTKLLPQSLRSVLRLYNVTVLHGVL